MKQLRILIHVSVLVAAEIVLNRFFSIATPWVKIGFGFVPIAVCAILYGPGWAALAGGLADFLGAIVFPFQGAYFPGFTLSAALTGLVFGLFLYRSGGRLPRIAGAVGANCLGVSLLLGTYWLHVLMGSPYLAILPTRVLQNAIMIPVQFILIRLIYQPVVRFAQRRVA